MKTSYLAFFALMLFAPAHASDDPVFVVPSLCKADNNYGDFILEMTRKGDDWSAMVYTKAGASNPIPKFAFPILKFSIVKSPNVGKDAVLLAQEVEHDTDRESIFIMSDITGGQMENHSVNLFFGPTREGRKELSADCTWIEDAVTSNGGSK